MALRGLDPVANKAIPKTFAEARNVILMEATSIMDKKRALRGTDNIERQGLSGVITRIAEDKMSRIQRECEDMLFWKMVGDRPHIKKTLSAAGWTPTDADNANGDSFEDDLLDVLNYAIIAVALHRGWWSLPG